MIKYNNSNINDWNFGEDNIIKVYRNNAVCYYKIASGDTPVQEPCFAVVDDISQYSDTEFEDVFNLADEKWYKLNNLNQYEEYGIYGSGRTICSAASFTELTDIIAQSTTALTNHNVTVTPAVGAFSKIRIDTTKSATTTSYTWATFTPTPNGSEVLGINTDSIGAMNGYGNNKNYVTDANGSQTFAHWVDNNHTIVEIDIAALSNNQASELYLLFYQENCNTAAFSFYMDVANCVTTYEGKLTIDDGYEYMYSGGSWVNVGEVSGSTIQTVWFDPPSSGDNARFNIGHYWGENYKMIWTMYIQGSYSTDISSFWKYENKSPIEFSLYSNGYYYDMHNPTSTSSPSVNTGDYSYRIIRTGVFRNYENSQVMNITLTYGSFKAELVDSGTVIENTGSTRTGFNWYNGLYEPSIFLQSSQKTHISRIQVYNANNELVNDIKFVKNNGVTGSQEISMYDSVLNVTYNNTNSNTPTYHIVEEGGGVEYPVYYDEIQDPPNNLSFSSMTEAEEYECPWVGMKATIDGDKYVFSGDSQSGYEWVYNPSRLPVGYTEVEYIQNTGTSSSNGAYLNLELPLYDAIGNSFVISSRLKSEFYSASGYDDLETIINSESVSSPYYGFVYRYAHSTHNIEFAANPSNHATLSTTANTDGTTYLTISCNSTTVTDQVPLGLFASYNANYNTPYRFAKATIYSFTVVKNGTLVRDLVPCKRDNDNTVGAYDIVNDVFYTVPTGYTTNKLIAGQPI